jgi:hypothetical protein
MVRGQERTTADNNQEFSGIAMVRLLYPLYSITSGMTVHQGLRIPRPIGTLAVENIIRVSSSIDAGRRPEGQ